MPLVISADGRRAGAAEELAAYTRLLGIELIVANKAASITRALQWRKENTPVLIDSPGVNPFDASQIQTVCGLAAAVGAMPVLILAAGQDAQEAAEHAEIFAASDIHHMVPTRLDLARRLGAIVAAAHAGSLILSEAGTGPGATEGLTPLTPAILAARLSQMPPFPQQAHDARLIR
jgi:flagellar biosynthesis protein FlhF